MPGTVTPMLAASGRTFAPIKVGNGPVALAFTPDETMAYAVNRDSGTVTPIEVATGRA